MKFLAGKWSFDSRDLLRSKCSHCTRVSVARELGVAGLQELIDEYFVKPDSLAIRYGIRFEEELENQLLSSLGDRIQQPASRSFEETQNLMDHGIPVIYQGVLRGGSGEIDFSGRPDFLLRGDYRFEFTDQGLTAVQTGSWQGGYTAWDAKLSSTAKPEYQNQVGLYVDVLNQFGLASPNGHGLILGNHELPTFSKEALLAQLFEDRNRYLDEVLGLIDNQPRSLSDLGELICEASSYCDVCEYPELCRHMRVETNHLQLVFGITRTQIESLHRSGVKTVAQLAEFAGTTDKLSPEVLSKLRRQAALQQRGYDLGQPLVEIIDLEVLTQLPPENPGDIFFDIEGFTFGQPGGIEYLFGYTTIDNGEQFHWLWADTREQERELFETFMVDVLGRLERNPGAKIYHYANYEQAALKRLSQRHGIFENEVGQLIDEGVFVDLFNVVKKSLVISQESYSIKKLENYYTFTRVSEVKEAMGSMEYYDQYLQAMEVDPAAAESLKRQVIAYNQDDCASTLALVRWLRSLEDGNV